MSTFEALINRAVKDLVIPGAVFFARDKHGKLNYSKAVGKKSLKPGDDAPMELNTTFVAASMTKLLTTIAALQIVERGMIGLEDDVSECLPVLASQQVLVGFADDGSPLLEKRRNPITLRLLLTHSSGAGYDFMDPTLTRYARYHGFRLMSGSTVDERFGRPLTYQPGEGWAYGSGIAWAGKLVERLTNQSLEDYMQENILKPLGISNITFFPDKHPDIKARLADTAKRDEATGKLVHNPRRGDFGSPDDCFGGEGAYSDMKDYMEVVYSLLLDDEKLLKSNTVALMFQPQLTPASKAMLAKAMDDPDWAVGDFSGPHEFDWGYGGILVDGDAHARRKRGYLAWSGALNLFWFIDRTAGVCGVFGTQVQPPADKLVRNVIKAFEEEVYAMVRNETKL